MCQPQNKADDHGYEHEFGKPADQRSLDDAEDLRDGVALPGVVCPAASRRAESKGFANARKGADIPFDAEVVGCAAFSAS